LVEANSGCIALSGRLRSPKISASGSFVPGLVEETALMLTHQPPKPVYLSRMMGGAAKIIIYVLETGQVPTELSEHPSRRLTRYLEQISAIGADRLAAVCGLTGLQLSELFDAQNLDTVVRLTALGIRHSR
jgi:hypothetical protein